MPYEITDNADGLATEQQIGVMLREHLDGEAARGRVIVVHDFQGQQFVTWRVDDVIRILLMEEAVLIGLLKIAGGSDVIQ